VGSHATVPRTVSIRGAQLRPFKCAVISATWGASIEEGQKSFMKITAQVVKDNWIEATVCVCEQTAHNRYNRLISIFIPSTKVPPKPRNFKWQSHYSENYDYYNKHLGHLRVVFAFSSKVSL